MTQDQSTPSQSWLSTNWWILVIAAAIGLALWGHSARISHTSYVSNLAGGDSIAIDANSPTGYEMGFRKLVVPEKNAEGSQWIMQVQQMFESGEFLLRHVDYDNAPDGRSVRTASLYRWWLGAIAWVDSAVSGTPIGVSVERAAMVADPIIQMIVLLLGSIFIARYFGGPEAALFSVGFVSIFPLGSSFAPAQPGDSALLLACTIGSVLPLLGAVLKLGDVTDKKLRRLFLFSGAMGGFGMWLGVFGILPVLVGIAIASAILALLNRRKRGGDERASVPLPWRAWAASGASVTLLAWLVERSHAMLDPMSWQSDFVHPLYALAWIGCGEVLVFLNAGKEGATRRAKFVLAFSVLAIGGLAYTMIFHGSPEGWSIDPADTRLTRLSSDPGVTSMSSWLDIESGGAMLLATFIPAALLIAGVLALVRSKASSVDFSIIIIAIVPLVISFGYAMVQLGWWSQFGLLALLLAVVVIRLDRLSEAIRWSSRGIVVFASLIGIGFVYPNVNDENRTTVELAELESLIERQLAQWLVHRGGTDGDAALAPPIVSVSLAYFGGLRVVGTPYSENEEGFSVAVRLSAASSADEAQALTTGREISLIILPSWDPFLEDYARLGTEQPENSFIALLNRWLPPRWLEPVYFQLPNVPGFENEWVVIFRTVEIQDNTSAIGRLVQYFLESGRRGLALRAQEALANNFSDELVTHITAAEIAMARGDRETFTSSVDSIIQSIDAGGDFYLTWEFRVSMTLLLANANQIEEMKTQLERCLVEADTSSVRRLSTVSLGKLLHLAKVLKMEFEDPELKEYAVSLLPSEMRTGLIE